MQDIQSKKSNTRLIVLTGGPGGGKTAVLEMAKKSLNNKTVVLPESASIIFGGGFWRVPSLSARAAAQRAIFYIQRELENLVCDEDSWECGLCDRGTLDGLAYWPTDEDKFWEMSQTNLEKELSRYYAVIHMRTPDDLNGYNLINSLRIENAEESKIIDDKIGLIWSKHPRYVEIHSTKNFLEKAEIALKYINKFQSESSI